MNKISDTMSLCEECYRHVPAIKFERDGAIWLGKTCPKHGYTEHLVEPNAKFYTDFVYPRHDLTCYFIEVTNRCNLTCPHCYQIPDNTSKDLPIELIVNQVASWEDDGYAISLAGAEPTVRKDLDQLITALQAIPGKPRSIIILTNGVRLANPGYAEKFKHFENLYWTIGLNHPDYLGPKVRAKQERGIKNAVAAGLKIKNISYTLENLEQVEYCLEEIRTFYPNVCTQFRIRVGVDIGRSPNTETMYLSQLAERVQQVCADKQWSYETNMQAGIRAHYPVRVDGIYVKLIQWPDIKTLDMEEMQTETWADLLPGKPISPLIHQVLLRDALINNKKILYDTVPDKYKR